MTPIGPSDAAQGTRNPVEQSPRTPFDTSAAKSRVQEIVQQITRLTGQEKLLRTEIADISFHQIDQGPVTGLPEEKLREMVRGTREEIEHLKQEKEALEQSMVLSTPEPEKLTTLSGTEEHSALRRKILKLSQEKLERIDLLHTFLPPDLLGQIIHACDPKTLQNLLLCSTKAERSSILANMGPAAALLFVTANPDNYITLHPNNPSKTNPSIVETTLRRKPSLFFELPNELQNDPILRMASYLCAHIPHNQPLCQRLIQFDEDNQPSYLSTFAAQVNELTTARDINKSFFRKNPELRNNLEAMSAFIILTSSTNPKSATSAENILKCASDALKKNPSFVLFAVMRCGWSLQWAHPELQRDPKIVLAAVKQDGSSLQWAHPELKKNRDIVLAAVMQNWWALEYADPDLKKDPQFVLAAVSKNGWALRLTSPELKKNRDIVLAAVTQNGRALECADPKLRDDPEIVQAAIQQNPEALQFASPRLQAILGRHEALPADIHPE